MKKPATAARGSGRSTHLARAHQAIPPRPCLEGAPPGPHTRRGVLQSFEDNIKILPKADLQSIMQKLGYGIHLVTDYSGTGQPEAVLQRARSLAAELGVVAKVDCARASDIAAHCRQVLLAIDCPDMCVLGDLVARQSAKFQKRLAATTDAARCKIQEAMSNPDPDRRCTLAERAREDWLHKVRALIVSSPCSTEQKAYCYRHQTECPVVPSPDVTDGKTPLRFVVAGISCLDWSSRGLQKKTLGKGAEAWACLLKEIFDGEPDTVVLECTRGYRHEDLELVLGSKYTLCQLVFSPTEVGIPSERFRKYMVMMKIGGMLKWKPGAEISEANFLKTFGRRLAVSGHVYMHSTPDKLIQSELDRWASRRNLPSRDADDKAFSFKSLLTTSRLAILEEWEEHATARGHGPQDEVMHDIAHHPQWGNLTAAAPAITRKNIPWSRQLSRPMLVEEKLEAQGFPVMHPEATLGLECPWGSALRNMSPSKLSSLAGNAMHFAAIGFVLAYVWAYTDMNSTSDSDSSSSVCD